MQRIANDSYIQSTRRKSLSKLSFSLCVSFSRRSVSLLLLLSSPRLASRLTFKRSNGHER